MSKRKKQIEEFFSVYEKHFNDAMTGNGSVEDSISHSFTECFVESTPAGVTCAKNDQQFAGKIHEAFDFYRNIGSKGMNIISKDITLLDDFHALTKVYWRYSYEKNEKKGTIDFNTFYLLNTVGNEPKIFAYVAGDEQKALRQSGLIPETAEVTH